MQGKSTPAETSDSVITYGQCLKGQRLHAFQKGIHSDAHWMILKAISSDIVAFQLSKNMFFFILQ